MRILFWWGIEKFSVGVKKFSGGGLRNFLGEGVKNLYLFIY